MSAAQCAHTGADRIHAAWSEEELRADVAVDGGEEDRVHVATLLAHRLRGGEVGEGMRVGGAGEWGEARTWSR